MFMAHGLNPEGPPSSSTLGFSCAQEYVPHSSHAAYVYRRVALKPNYYIILKFILSRLGIILDK